MRSQQISVFVPDDKVTTHTAERAFILSLITHSVTAVTHTEIIVTSSREFDSDSERTIVSHSLSYDSELFFLFSQLYSEFCCNRRVVCVPPLLWSGALLLADTRHCPLSSDGGSDLIGQDSLLYNVHLLSDTPTFHKQGPWDTRIKPLFVNSNL